MGNKYLTIPVLGFLLFLLAGGMQCTCLEGYADGGGNESSNAFIRGTTTFKAAPSAGLSETEVYLYKVDIKLYDDDPRIYSWEPIETTYTDSEGNFIFPVSTVEDTFSDEYAIMIERDTVLKSFSGYFIRASAEDSVLDDSLLVDKTKKITGIFTDKLKLEDRIVIDTVNDDTSRIVLEYITIRLVGTPHATRVGANGSFVFRNVPANNFKMEVYYKAQIDGSDLVLPHYTAFVANTLDTVGIRTEPFVLQDKINIISDAVAITSKDYEITYSIEDE